MNLPRQVQKQVDEAARISGEIAKLANPEAPVVVPAPAELDAAFGAEPSTPAPVEQPAAPPPPPPVQSEQPAQPEAKNWQHMFQTLKGKYDKEVPRLHAELATMRAEIQRLSRSVAAPNATKPNGKAEPTPTLVRKEEEEEYGKDLLDVVGRRAREVLLPEISTLSRRVDEVLSRFDAIENGLSGVAGSLKQRDQQTVFAKLDEKVQDWRTINENPEFLAWLDEPDAYAGVPRTMLLRKAFEEGNAERCIAFFNGWKSEQAAVTGAQPLAPSAPQEPNPPELVQGRAPAVSLDTLAAPGRPRTTPAGTEPQKPIIRAQQVKQFFDDVARGRYKNDPEKKRRIEAGINEAAAQGRIVP